tara:strand:+ start:983 stop:1273 length:291 start_codon:yes stop_codon:yes gene_type:complete
VNKAQAPLYINNTGQPIYWRDGIGGLADWKEKVAVADLVYAFSDRRDTKTVGVITKLKWGGCPSDDSAVVKWFSHDCRMGSLQYLYNLYPIELGSL